MSKKCVDCAAQAKFKIKDTSEFYCGECAEEHFADLSLLVAVENEALKLKGVVNNFSDEQ